MGAGMPTLGIVDQNAGWSESYYPGAGLVRQIRRKCKYSNYKVTQ